MSRGTTPASAQKQKPESAVGTEQACLETCSETHSRAPWLQGLNHFLPTPCPHLPPGPPFPEGGPQADLQSFSSGATDLGKILRRLVISFSSFKNQPTK